MGEVGDEIPADALSILDLAGHVVKGGCQVPHLPGAVFRDLGDGQTPGHGTGVVGDFLKRSHQAPGKEIGDHRGDDSGKKGGQRRVLPDALIGFPHGLGRGLDIDSAQHPVLLLPGHGHGEHGAIRP